MHPKDAGNLLKHMIQTGSRIPLILEGESGIGKSQIVKDVGRELGWKVIDIRAALVESAELGGMPKVDEKRRVMYYARPEWMPEADSDEKVIVFFDEVNRGPQDTRQGIFQFLTEFRMHLHQMRPENTFIVAAINPDNSHYQVESIDTAMINRFCRIEVTHDIDQWLVWAREHKLHEMVVKFLSVNQNLLLALSDDGKPFPSPRTWERVSHLMNLKAVPDHLFREVVAGLVGQVAAVTFLKFLDKNYDAPISGRDVLEKYPEVQKELKKQTKEANDKVHATVRDLASLLASDASLLSTGSGRKNVIDFSFDLPEEYRMAFLKKLIGTDALKIIGSDKTLTKSINKITEEAGEKK